MVRLQVGVATCATAPGLDEDGELLLAALAEAGVDAQPAVWDDLAVDWSGFDGVLVRSVWDYPLRREAFLAWTHACRRTANPQEVLAWNTDKRYLADLSRDGVPTVPTAFLPPGAALHLPDGDYVLKPTVSGSAADTGRFGGPDRRASELAAAGLSGSWVRTLPCRPSSLVGRLASRVDSGRSASHGSGARTHYRKWQLSSRMASLWSRSVSGASAKRWRTSGGSKMQPGQVLFGQYVSGTVQLVIPRYQRPYEWKIERWIDLWRDISNAYRKRNPKLPASKRITPPAHFMGPLILEDDGAHPGGAAVRRLVVDGQQRLLTLFVIRAAIRDHDAVIRKLTIEPDNDLAFIHPEFGSDPIERVELEKAYRDVYAAIAAGDFMDEVPEQYATDNLANAYAFFRYQLWRGRASLEDYDPSPPPRPSRKHGAPQPGSYAPWGELVGKTEAVDLSVLASVLATGLKMLEIVLDANDEEASVVFETMNSKNTPLRQFDHLRNSVYVCMRTRREQFHAKRWRPVEDTLAAISYSSLRNPPEEQFFYEYMISLGEGRVNLKDLHRNFMERVYRDLGYPPRDEKLFEKRYAEPFAQAALMYPLALGQVDATTIFGKKFKIPAPSQILIREILSMSGGPPVPVVLRLLTARFNNELKSDQDLQAALSDVQSFLVRMMLAGDRLSPLRSVFMQVCGSLETDVSIGNVRDALKKVGWPTNDQVRSSCTTTDLYSYGGSVMFPILRGIEKQLAKAGAHALPYGSGPDDYSIEHIFPQSPSIGAAWLADLKVWGIDTGPMIERRHCLGNLTAVTKYDNSKNGRKSFDVKQSLIKSVAPIRLNDSILAKRRWTPTIIDARTKALAEAALKHWPRS